MKTLRSLFGIFAIAMAFLTVFGTTAKGQSSETYSTGIRLNIGTNSAMTGTMSVPQFNPALGVLDSVEIGNAIGSYSSAVTVSGPDLAEANVEASALINNNFGGPQIGLAWEKTFELPDFPNLAGSDFNDEGVGFYATYNSPAILSEFTGDGNFNFQVTGSQSFLLNPPSPGVTIDINSATLALSEDVIYNYTVPEPSSFSLLVVGFGILAATRKAGNLHG